MDIANCHFEGPMGKIVQKYSHVNIHFITVCLYRLSVCPSVFVLLPTSFCLCLPVFVCLFLPVSVCLYPSVRICLSGLCSSLYVCLSDSYYY